MDNWTKDDNKYITMMDKGYHPGYIFREVKDGHTYENKSIDSHSNTYHHAWTKDVYKKEPRARPMSAKPV